MCTGKVKEVCVIPICHGNIRGRIDCRFFYSLVGAENTKNSATEFEITNKSDKTDALYTRTFYCFVLR